MIPALRQPERRKGDTPSLRSGRLEIAPTLAARLSGTPLAILLDIDGTLAPIAPRPDGAVVPAVTLDIISKLARLPNTHVAVVTGRAVAAARKLVPLDGIGVIGNHGFEILGEDGEMIIAPEARAHRDALRWAAARLAPLAARHPGVILEDKTWTISVHTRLAARAEIPEITAAVTKVASEVELALTRGKEILELRPPIQVHKGTSAVEWAKRVGATETGASTIYIGDDRTDEDAFQALRAAAPHAAITIRVGEPDEGEATFAEFGVASPDQVREFLNELLAIRGANPRT
jgi:trehalose 6-phosphate phosphatase